MKDKIIGYTYLTVLALIVFFLLYWIAGVITVKVSHRYTIGATKGIVSSPRGPVDVCFEFSVKGKLYRHQHGGSIDKKERVGSYFLVRYVSFFPRWSEMDFSIAVDTSVIKPPFDGWEEMPEELKKN